MSHTARLVGCGRVLKEKFSELTDADLKFQPGKEKDLIERLEMRLSKKREEVVFILNDLFKGNEPFKTGVSL